MRELIDCKRDVCEYFRKYNGVQRTASGSYMTDFITIEERCSHPDMMKKQPRSLEDPGGVKLVILNECPNEKNRNNK